ncbi:MAG TPA: hypothetical protein DCS30_11010 [Rhizobiales bacterium]|nr:hypothetical protein [Hyphomicrobiales bacterium]
MYEFSKDKILWKGKTLKGADASSFESLSPTIGRDATSIYVNGKIAKVDKQSFEVLSNSYARDREAVYLIMETKLKPVKNANPATFVAIGDCFGRDSTSAFFRTSKMRLNKGCNPENLKSLGHVYATDGVSLFFGTERHAWPDDLDASGPEIKLKWFCDNEVNLPILTLTDGQTCWVAIYHNGQRWWECQGAGFETLAPLAFDNDSTWNASYVRDDNHIWFYGASIAGANPAKVYMFGQDMLSNGNQIWHGDRLIAQKASDISYICHYSTYNPDYLSGPLVHQGDQLVVHDLEKGPQILAQTSGMAERLDQTSFDEILTSSLREIYSTLLAIICHFPPIVNTPGDIGQKLQENPQHYIKPDTLPDFQAKLHSDGQIELTLSDGTILQQPLSCWYTLGCHLCCMALKREPMFLPYPPVGTMLPNSVDMHLLLMKRHRSAFWNLTSAALRHGHEQEARILAHFCFSLALGHIQLDAEMLQELVEIPRELMSNFQYDMAHHAFEVTTNLAVGRLILRDRWLEAEDFRDRIDVIDTLHGAILETDKIGIFYQEIIPQLMARYGCEPLPGVREHLAMTLEAALIRGQVDGEVSHKFHNEAMLPIIEFCIANGINTYFNRARLAETLWALDRDMEANTMSETLIADIGEDAHLPGVYCHRHIYRTPRLWFLRGKTDIAYRKADLATHEKRLAALEADYDMLIARYGEKSSQWDEMKDIKADIGRYKDAITSE